ncbi:hypothetical protein Taro_044714 [Colocasia esculenta]|uniref:Uncharacterized protein n=1 Tax=Colocasia esculenta TaxID=4460 RepID=A0A843X1D3_COLES|nr:hypothetical protein [Colocasia esculenta]
MRAGRHWTSLPEQPVFRIGIAGRHHHQGRSTLDLVPRTACCQIWDSVSTPPPRQVDTLQKYSNLRWMIATCQPRAMVYQRRIVCPCT